MTTADLTTHAKNLLQKNIDNEIRTAHWIDLQDALNKVRYGAGILAIADQHTVVHNPANNFVTRINNINAMNFRNQ